MEAERLYGLALALAGDEDVAGDLVLAARNEADLRRRAAAWRGARGLQPSAEPLEPLELNPEQAEHARHLWRRRSIRRRLQRSLLAAGGVAAALLLGLGALRFAAQQPPRVPDQLAGWEKAEVFASEAVAQSEAVSGYRLVVYRVEATPDALLAYWALTGPGAGRPDGSVDPILARGGAPVYSSQLTTRPAGFDRLVGRSTYHVLAPDLNPVDLQLSHVAGVPANLSVRAPVQRGDYDPQAPTYFFSNEVAGDGAFQVTSVTLGKEYTSLKYRLNGTSGQDSLQRVGIKVGTDRWVPWRNTWMSGPYGMEGEAIFDPLPAGARTITVHASATGFHTSVLSVTQNGSIPEGVASLGPWRRDGPTIEATLNVHDPNVIVSNAGYLLDAANRRFAVILMRDAEGQLFIRGWESHAGFEPVALVTELTRFTPGLEIQIDLP